MLIDCPKGTFGSCAGTLILTPANPHGKGADQRRSSTIGRASFTIRSGKGKRVTLRLSGHGQALVRQVGQISALATVGSRDGSGSQQHRAATITLLAR
jgi:hypothetical protein